MASASEILRSVFGHGSFRSGQQEVCEALLGGHDALVVLPTGGGKSLCYQLPAMAIRASGGKAALIVSPLIALMEDQVAAAKGRGIRAAAMHSQQTPEFQLQVWQQLGAGELDLLYVSPERAVRSHSELLGHFDLFAIDEAHCIAQWGHDFRPEYAKLATLKEELGAPTVALTATATPRVCTQISASLGLQHPFVYRGDFRRPNLSYRVSTFDRDKQRLNALVGLLGEHGMRSSTHGRAIVYCATRREVDQTASELRSRGFGVGAYHAGREDQGRSRALRAYEVGRTPVLVATNAFGMGMDHPNVRLVVHRQCPGSLEAYYQEAGRAGRDGEAATCALLFHPDDTRIHTALNENAGSSLRAMLGYVSDDGCRQAALCAHFDEDRAQPICGVCDQCTGTGDADEPTDVEDDLPPPHEMDLIVEAVDALPWPVGKTNLANALRGSRSKQLRKLGLVGLPQHGKLRHRNQREICDMVDLLLQDGRVGRGTGSYATLWPVGKTVVDWAPR